MSVYIEELASDLQMSGAYRHPFRDCGFGTGDGPYGDRAFLR